MARPAGPALLELTTAVNVAVQALPRRARDARWRLERAVRDVVVLAGAGHLVLERPNREVALEQLGAAIRIARAAGVDWREVVTLVNGDDER